MNNVIATVISFAVKGASAAETEIGGVNKAAGVCVHGLSTLASSLGSMGGTIGKVASQAANFMWSIQQMGALGGIMAGAQIAITQISKYFIDKVDEMAEAVKRAGERIRANLEKITQARLDKVNEALEEATTKAQKAANAFDALASAYLKVQAAQNATASSASKAEISALSLEKSQKMSGAKDDGERALIGADYDIKIAEANKKAVRDEQDRKVQAAKDEAAILAKKADDSVSKENKSEMALDKAKSEYEYFASIGHSSGAAKAKDVMDKAQTSYDNAKNDRVKKEADAAAAEERIIQAQNERTAAINESTQRLTEAREASDRLVDAQKKSAQAELDRIKATKAAEDAARKKAESDAKAAERDRQASSLRSMADAASNRFNESFELWRDPEAAAQAVEADKKRGEDMKRFRKEVNRYGGKGKIDEYAALMRAGDEEGMQAKLQEWRKSSKFTPQTEQLVKAAAADQNKNAAERSLEKIQENTSKLAEKLDQLLQVK